MSFRGFRDEDHACRVRERRARFPLGRFVRARLHRRIFVWFGLTILVTSIALGVLMALMGQRDPGSFRREIERTKHFVSGRFAHAWDSPAERDDLARAMAEDLDLDVSVVDARGAVLVEAGAPCGAHAWRLPVERRGALLGQVHVCADRHNGYASWKIVLGFGMCGVFLWGASGLIARRIAKPIAEVARVAEEIGAGKLDSRVPRGRGRHEHGEVMALSSAINAMAEKIEHKMREQRELLAAVSHEIRTPLSRMRLLLELAREAGVDDPSLNEIEREVLEMDRLVSELLASSRLDFAALSLTPLDARDLGARALERAGLAKDKLAVGSGDMRLSADATLLARALANLVDNALAHGGGVDGLRVSRHEDFIVFEVEDRGPGFAEGESQHVFQPFFRGASSQTERPSLGLGLALVARIAEAHGGSAFAEGREGGGARVGFRVRVKA